MFFSFFQQGSNSKQCLTDRHVQVQHKALKDKYAQEQHRLLKADMYKSSCGRKRINAAQTPQVQHKSSFRQSSPGAAQALADRHRQAAVGHKPPGTS